MTVQGKFEHPETPLGHAQVELLEESVLGRSPWAPLGPRDLRSFASLWGRAGVWGREATCSAPRWVGVRNPLPGAVPLGYGIAIEPFLGKGLVPRPSSRDLVKLGRLSKTEHISLK